MTRVLPTYPEIARRSRTTGTVVVEAQIDDQGKVVKATAVSGPLILRPEAEIAVMKWAFRPATLGGVNVPSASRVSIVFTNVQ
jgi:TonB family protein